MSNDRIRFQTLDGWRGICALFVALLHIPIKDGFLSLPFFNGAYLFVDFFFVLSGFVISYSYGGALETNQISWQKFLLNRFARLWPLHMALFGCYVILNLAKLALYGWYHTASGPPPTIFGLIITSFEQIFLLQALIPSPAGVGWNGQSWSISTEFWTYILFMMVMMFYPKKLPLPALISASSAMIVVFLSKSGMNIFNWLGFFRCFYGFFLGYLLYQIYASNTSKHWQSTWRQSWSTATEAVCIISVVVLLALSNDAGLGFLAPVLFALVIYVFAAESGSISDYLSGAFCQMLGRYSYSIYMTFGLVIAVVIGGLRICEKLLHVHLIKAMQVDGASGDDYLIHFGTSWEMIAIAGMILGGIVVISHFTYFYIEIPCKEFLKKIKTP